MTEGQPFPYHVFTAVLGAEGGLRLPTSALLLYLHFLPLETRLALVAEYRFLPGCPCVTSFGTEACVLPFLSPIPSSDFIRKSHLPYWLKVMVDLHCGMHVAACSVCGLADQPGPNRVLPLPCLSNSLKLFLAYTRSALGTPEIFLHLTLHTDFDKTKHSDARRGR